MPKAIQKHGCQVCGREYVTEAEAVVCETQPEDEPCVKVGDIIFAGAGYGWFDGDKSWVSNLGIRRKKGHGNCFGECCTMRFFFVVTAIDKDDRNPHRVRYHLFTKAMSGKEGHRCGYTFNNGHTRPSLVKKPPSAVVSGSKDLIGQKADYLL